VGRSWEWRGRVGDQNVTTVFRVVRIETISVTAGTYEGTFAVESETTSGARSIRKTVWYAKEVGPVQERSVIVNGAPPLMLDAGLLVPPR
jgi:hypothetical protein